MIPMTAPSNYFCMAKITEAILNKIKVCGTFIVKFHTEIHLLKYDSRYQENKWHCLHDITDLEFVIYGSYVILSLTQIIAAKCWIFFSWQSKNYSLSFYFLFSTFSFRLLEMGFSCPQIISRDKKMGDETKALVGR